MSPVCHRPVQLADICRGFRASIQTSFSFYKSKIEAVNTDMTNLLPFSRQDWNPLPLGVRAEGDRLHFLNTASELDGLYICKAVNQLGVGTGSLYRKTTRHTEL